MRHPQSLSFQNKAKVPSDAQPRSTRNSIQDPPNAHLLLVQKSVSAASRICEKILESSIVCEKCRFKIHPERKILLKSVIPCPFCHRKEFFTQNRKIYNTCRSKKAANKI